MKKFIAVILALVLVISFVACGEEKKETEQETYTAVQIREELDETALKEKLANDSEEVLSIPENILYVDTLNEALMTLKSNKATGFMTTEATARYVAARDSELLAASHPSELPPVTLHIVALPESTELIDKINGAISAMKADGTMDKLYADYVTAVLESGEPADVEIPTFEGSQTITIGVSGDLPPVDYVNTDGKPVGFNVAVIAEIANRLQINIKTEIVAAGTRFMALESKRIDAFFWEMDVVGKGSGYALSEPYAEMPGGILIKKDKRHLESEK